MIICIFYEFFNQILLKIYPGKSFKDFFWMLNILLFYKKIKILYDLSDISLECLLLDNSKDSNNWFINI